MRLWRIGMFCWLFFVVTAAYAANQQPLSASEAFVFSAKQVGNITELSWSIAPDYYLYKDKFKFELQPAGVTVTPMDFPAGIKKEDSFLGKYEVYFDQLKLSIPLN